MVRTYQALEEVTAPAVEPLTLTEAKDFLRVSGSDDDTLITSLIVAARLAVEQYTNRKLITQTWDLWMDDFPGTSRARSNETSGVYQASISTITGPKNSLELMISPLQSVTYLKTYDEDDADTTMTSTLYQVDTKGRRPRLSLKDGSVWPSTILRPTNGIQIRCVAGYGNASTDVPQPLIEGVRHTLVHYYDCRGAASGVPKMVMAMLNPYRVVNI